MLRIVTKRKIGIDIADELFQSDQLVSAKISKLGIRSYFIVHLKLTQRS